MTTDLDALAARLREDAKELCAEDQRDEHFQVADRALVSRFRTAEIEEAAADALLAARAKIDRLHQEQAEEDAGHTLALKAACDQRDAALQRAKEAETLALFGLACLDEARRELGDLDGGWIEDTGRTMGVLTAVEVTERCTADEGACRCEEYGFPTTCVRDSEAVKAYRAARPVPPGEGAPGG